MGRGVYGAYVAAVGRTVAAAIVALLLGGLAADLGAYWCARMGSTLCAPTQAWAWGAGGGPRAGVRARLDPARAAVRRPTPPGAHTRPRSSGLGPPFLLHAPACL